MAQRAGIALQQRWQHEQASAAPCPCCGHPTGDHRERQPRWEFRDGDLVAVYPDDYRPLLFFCNHEGCECGWQL